MGEDKRKGGSEGGSEDRGSWGPEGKGSGGVTIPAAFFVRWPKVKNQSRPSEVATSSSGMGDISVASSLTGFKVRSPVLLRSTDSPVDGVRDNI